MEQTKDIFGKRLFEIRESHKESQQELADSIGITRQSLSRYELGERTANIDLLKKIAKHYNISADYLLGLADNSTVDLDLGKFLEYTGLNEKAYNKLCVNYRLKEEFEQMVDDGEYNNIQNWIISNHYLHRIINVLSSIKKMSKDIAKIIQKENSLPPNVFYDICEMVEYGAIENIKDNVGIEEVEFDDLIFEDLIRTNTLCDTKRYNLIKIVEEMANNFDQRNQVRNNGKHNPPKE